MTNQGFNLPELFITEQIIAPDGWTYRSIPWMLPEYWDKLIDILGEDNIQYLATTSKRNKQGKVFTRGQILISDAGMARLKEHNSKNSEKSA